MESMGFLILVAVIFIEYRMRKYYNEQKENIDGIKLMVSAILKDNKTDISEIDLPDSIKDKIRTYIRKKQDDKAQKFIEDILCVESKVASLIYMKYKDPLIYAEIQNEKLKQCITK